MWDAVEGSGRPSPYRPADPGTAPRLLPRDARRLRLLLPEREGALVTRVLQLADEHGYARFAATLIEAWRASVVGLTDAVVAMVDRSTLVPAPHADEDAVDDPTTTFLVDEARRHRGRGVTLALFLGLFRYYRLAYHEVVEDVGFEDLFTVHLYLEGAFDRMELAYTTEWTGASAEQQVHDLSIANLEATQEKTRLLALIETLPLPALLVSPDGRLHLANGPAATLLDLPATPGATYYGGDSEPRPAPSWLRPLLVADDTATGDVVLDSPLGRRTYRVEARRVLDATGHGAGHAVLLQDVTAQRDHVVALRRAAAVFGATSDAGLVTDPDGTIVAVNPAFTAALGWTERACLGRNAADLLRSPPLCPETAADAWSEGCAGEVTLAGADGRDATGWLTLTPVEGHDGAVREVVALLADAAPTVAPRPPDASRHDALTGLSNRLEAREQVRDGVAQATRHAAHVAVLSLDLDRFAAVNDEHGEHRGNEVLQQVARRLRAALDPEDTLARLGGDEFLVVARDLPSATEAGVVAERVLAALAEPVHVGTQAYDLTGSIGISTFPDDGLDDPEALIRAADEAMHHAKHESRNAYRFHSRDLGERSSTRLRLAAALRRAVSARQIALEFQPVVDLRHGGVCAVEALARWSDDTLGAVPPAAFLPLAEDLHLIPQLGRQLLSDAVAALSWWQLGGTPLRHVSVNVARTQVEEAGFAAYVLDLLAGHGLQPDDLVLDVPETALARMSDHGVTVLARLADAGVRVAVDDFGSGATALARLSDLPVDIVKLDRRLLTGAGGMPEQQRQAVLESVVAMAHAYGLAAVVTCVQHVADLEAAVRAGADFAQGFLLARPLPARRVPGFVAGMSGALPPLT